MALPRDNQPWPPSGWGPVLDKLAEWSAWYSGDPNQIANVYARMARTPTRRGRHWEREIRDERKVMLHVPVAGDVAATSADMLFSEIPDIAIPEAQEQKAPKAATDAQDRLQAIVEEGGIHNRLLEAAETASALGGVFIGPVWDREVADMPIMRVIQADAALPEFRWGFLVGVTLWQVLEDDNGVVWRHIERHDPGVILHGLYRGTSDNLGRRVALDARPETTGLQERVELPDAMRNTLAVRYVPNARPNRGFRGNVLASYLGRSDYAGSESLMDALDEAYTSWQRDIRLGKSRGIVPEDWLEKPDGSHVLRFDEDREFFVGVSVSPTQGAQPEMWQPDIRFEAHERTTMAYLERIITTAGYSPQTFGLHIEGRAETGTALRIRERKSLVTSQRKQRFWEPAIADVLWMMLAIDREIFGSGVEVYRPSVDIGDSIAESVRDVAESVELLHRAKAASTRTRVMMLHPEWTEAEVDAEVERIHEEDGSKVPDPFQIGMA